MQRACRPYIGDCAGRRGLIPVIDGRQEIRPPTALEAPEVHKVPEVVPEPAKRLTAPLHGASNRSSGRSWTARQPRMRMKRAGGKRDGSVSSIRSPILARRAWYTSSSTESSRNELRLWTYKSLSVLCLDLTMTGRARGDLRLRKHKSPFLMGTVPSTTTRAHEEQRIPTTAASLAPRTTTARLGKPSSRGVEGE